MDKYAESYQREANENLEELEEALLELEGADDGRELINQVFRKFHTIKGSGSMFGFDDVAAFTHDIETIYDLVRNEKIQITKELISLSLSACDIIKDMVNNHEIDIDQKEEISRKFAAMMPASQESNDSQTFDDQQPPLKNYCNLGEVNTFRIRLKSVEKIFQYGAKPLLMFKELKSLGKCTTSVNLDDVPLLEKLTPEICYMKWDIILTANLDINAVKDIFIFVEDYCDISVEVIDYCSNIEEENFHRKLGDILLERKDLTIDDLNKALSNQKKIGQVLIDQEIVSQGDIAAALNEQRHFDSLKKKHQEKVATSSIRVPSNRLDRLMDLVGEIVTLQARLSEEVKGLKRSNLKNISEEMERLSSDLRDRTMSIRMLPIETLFSKFKRVVRDLSQELGKNVLLSVEGGETEVDKYVLEQLNDPLVHLIRNSIDHGIESEDERADDNKPLAGNLRLKARHFGDNVLVEIEDDGRGLDPEHIKSKAIEKGLVFPNADLSENDIYMLIFTPGFSTAKTVTGISGRGVGMDVVKKNLDALQGSVHVASHKGKGTTITLKIPLTLAIIDGLMVKIGEGDYIFPLYAVEECLELTRKEADRARKRHMMELRGKMVDYISLSDYFNTATHRPPYEKIVVVDSNGKKIGLGVDSVIGKYQTVIKSLGQLYKNSIGLSGATIKGDGTIALIIDVNQLGMSAKPPVDSYLH